MKTVDELVSENTLNELKIMFEELYGIPCYYKTKRDIAQSIRYYHEESERTADLAKILQFSR